MISSMDFVRQSLDIHLFFARIMKDHAFTQKAEMATSYFTGIRIPVALTQAEAGIMGGGKSLFTIIENF